MEQAWLCRVNVHACRIHLGTGVAFSSQESKVEVRSTSACW